MNFTPAPTPETERERLAVLRGLGALDTEGGPRFQEIVDTAAHVFGAPMAFVSLVDADRLWFFARHGVETREERRDVSFCAHAILHPEPLVLLNAGIDRRVSSNPLVQSEPYVRFYAGAPVMVQGHAMGTLCILDFEPRFRFSERETETLKFLAGVAAERLAERSG
ncbi:GAF domain-containing protein [Glycocaulis profundi]|nr:GAF domain-containing protein [Glycocaulis profundi]